MILDFYFVVAVVAVFRYEKLKDHAAIVAAFHRSYKSVPHKSRTEDFANPVTHLVLLCPQSAAW